jgi:hypothetical protein
MNAITEAIKTQRAGKGDAALAKKVNAMVQDLAEGDQCQRSAPLTIVKNQFVGFSQNDTAWSGKKYNSINATIGDAGCALCNMASILKLLGYDVTPLTLNTWMMNNHGKDYEYYDNSGRINWNTVTDYAGENKISHPQIPLKKSEAVELHRDPDDNRKLIGTSIPPEKMGETVDTWLNNGYYVVAEVKNVIDHGKNKGREDTHFVRLEDKENGNYNIYDPGDSNRTTLASYNNQIYKAIIYIVYK